MTRTLEIVHDPDSHDEPFLVNAQGGPKAPAESWEIDDLDSVNGSILHEAGATTVNIPHELSFELRLETLTGGGTHAIVRIVGSDGE